MIIVDEQFELFVVINSKGDSTQDIFLPIKNLILENPNTKFIIHNDTAYLGLPDKLINTIKLIFSNLIVYARIEMDYDKKILVQIYTIDVAFYFHYVLKFVYVIGEKTKLVDKNIEELSQLLFTTNECIKCKYYTNEIALRCAVNPTVTLNHEQRCSDYIPKISKYPFKD